MRSTTAILLMCGTVPTAFAQSRDPGTLVRDLATGAPSRAERPVPVGGTAATAATVDGGHSGVVIGAVRVEGIPDLPRESFAAAITPFLGKSSDEAALRALATAVAAVARQRGYVFASATIPEQAIEAGTVAVWLDGGRIDAVRITGSTSRRLKRTLERLIGTAIDRAALERQLLLAEDIPGITIVSTNYAREGNAQVLVVEAREDGNEGYASVDNFGSDDVGPIRARLRYDFIGLADADDVFTMQAIATPAEPGDLLYANVRYAVLLDDVGTTVNVTAGVGRVEPHRLNETPVTSTSTYLAAGIARPLLRRNATSIWANAELAFQRLDNEDGSLRDSLSTLGGWLYATTRTGEGRLSGALGVTGGLPVAGTTVAGDPRASRAGAGARFVKGWFWADWTLPVGGGFGLRFGANGQLADRPLLASQEIGLGGVGFGRSYDFYERFGDSGLMGSAELRWVKQRPIGGIDWIQPYAFVDGGRVWNRGDDFGSGRLASAGGGVRLAIGKTELALEAALPVARPDGSTTRRARANLSIGRRFR